MYMNEANTCWFSGKRLPELVTGKLVEVCDQLHAQESAALCASVRHSLSMEEWRNVLLDFTSFKQVVLAELAVKFDWAKRLPWHLAALAHPDEETARKAVLEDFTFYQNLSDELRATHHARTHELFHQHAQDVIAFCAGAPLATLPALQRLRSIYCGISICETRIEAEHATVKNIVKEYRHSPVAVSLSRRQPVLERNLSSSAESFRNFVGVFGEVQDVSSWQLRPSPQPSTNPPKLLSKTPAKKWFSDSFKLQSFWLNAKTQVMG